MPCPPAQSLREYAIGDLDDALSEEIERHLAACPACETTLADFDAAEDTLMRHLPLAAVDVADASAGPPGWLERLRNGPPAEPDAAEPPDEDDAVAPQAELSAYELLGVLGRGGMGIVYRARHRQLHREVALKVLSPRVMATPEARRRFEREIQILGGLQHPGIVMATDAGRAGRAAYLVMELIDGVDLAQLVRRGGPLTVDEACEAGRQMARALAAAHETGTIHRDVKPSNAMVDRQGRVKLLDFGLAHLAVLSTESLETSLGRLLGTLDYMAPEQADGDRTVDARADLYGLGATLFYLLTGRPPHGDHHGRSLLDQLKALTAAEAPRVSTLRGDVPDELDALIARLLNRDPDNRPPSAEAVADALSAWAGGDLSARVQEMPAPQEETERAFDDRERARQSLLDLLGPDASAPPSRPADPPPSRRRWAARLGRLTAAAAVIGAVLFGVTLLLETPEGTLRIESEVDDVQVKLVDEQNQTTGLTIHRGETETHLRAGRYHIRLAAHHDNLRINKNVITLQRGQETVARIQQTPPDVMETVGPAPTADDAITDERLYQGKPESEWQRLFESEIDPVAKLKAAEALLTLAAARPPGEHIERILDIGEEIVRASFGDQSLVFALEDGSHPAIRAIRWPLNIYGIHGVYASIQRKLNDDVRRIPAEILADVLSRAAVEGSEPRAAFALSLLRYAAKGKIGSDPAAVSVVIKRLDVPLTAAAASAICQLVRIGYFRHDDGGLGESEWRECVTSVTELADSLRRQGANELGKRIRIGLNEALVTVGRTDHLQLPPDLQLSIARMILDDIVHHRGRAWDYFPFGLGVPGSRPPYGAQLVEKLRDQMTHFLDAWLAVANGYLQQHTAPPYDRATREVVQSLDMVLRLYSEGDDWPVEETASLFTEQLRAYYTDDPAETTSAMPRDILPDTPAMLLTQIVRITGEVPDFVRNGHPRAESAAKRSSRFATILWQRQLEGAARDLDAFLGLMDEVPYQVISLCIGQNQLPKTGPSPLSVRGIPGYATPERLLYATSAVKEDRNNRRKPPVDPLLLLIVLGGHAGRDEAQDARIASLLAPSAPEVLLRGHLDALLSGSLKAGAHVRRLLKQMVAKAKSRDLVEAIRYLDPSLVPAAPGERGT